VTIRELITAAQLQALRDEIGLGIKLLREIIEVQNKRLNGIDKRLDGLEKTK